MNMRALSLAIVAGTILQVLMVVVGHSNESVKSLFAIGGMGISLIAGAIYTAAAGNVTVGAATLGGAVSGGVCALLGIAVSCFLGDVPASLLVLGTASSIVTGALGGWLASFFMKRQPTG